MQVYILINNHWFQINAGSNFLIFLIKDVVKYAEENSGEAAARRFSVNSKRVTNWRKNQTELQSLSEEDSNRAKLPGGGRKKASKEPEINMRG